MKTYEVNVTESAEIDLHDIITYISEQFMAEITAMDMLHTIETSLSSLATFPERLPLVSDDRLQELGYRKLGIKNYGAFYTIDKKREVVNIERILYMRRDWVQIL